MELKYVKGRIKNWAEEHGNTPRLARQAHMVLQVGVDTLKMDPSNINPHQQVNSHTSELRKAFSSELKTRRAKNLVMRMLNSEGNEVISRPILENRSNNYFIKSFCAPHTASTMSQI